MQPVNEWPGAGPMVGWIARLPRVLVAARRLVLLAACEAAAEVLPAAGRLAQWQAGSGTRAPGEPSSWASSALWLAPHGCSLGRGSSALASPASPCQRILPESLGFAMSWLADVRAVARRLADPSESGQDALPVLKGTDGA